ncbi:MAG: tyrosine-type recombinase/integrase [Actinomycetota bacterium]
MKTFRLKSEATKYLSTIEASKVRGSYLDPALGRVTFGSYTEAFLAGAVDLSPSTRATYETEARLYLLPALGAQPIASIRPADLRALVSDLQARGVGARTIQLVRQTASRVLRQAVEDGLIASNPAARVRAPKTERRAIRILSVEEVEALADAFDPRYRALVHLGAYAGLRFGEASALRIVHLRLLERRIEIAEGASEVNGRLYVGPLKTAASRRVVTIPAFLADELGAHLATRRNPDGSDLVFPAPGGGHLRRTSFGHRFWTPAVHETGLDPAPVFHDLRHTAVALAIAEGAHPKAIQARLGHASITTTLNTYGHLFPALDVELADRLDAARAERLAAYLRRDEPAGARVVKIREH